jgi:N-acyl-D-amino-acid deacylase
MPEYDLIIRNGTLYDGSGEPPVPGDVAITGDTIVAVGQLLADATAATEIDAGGMAVAPGFINMLSWSSESLIEDGRSQSEIRQGVTLEVMGEGSSMGPLNDAMKQAGPGSYMAQGHIQYDIEWTTLGEYLEWLEKRGVSCNIASFVGSSTLRIHVMGYDNRPPTPEELDQMQALLRQAIQEGAMGLSAALIYAPAVYANTVELIELAHVLREYGGMYITHLRSEGQGLIDALEEFIEIVEETDVPGEVYHLKAAGQAHWDKLDEAIRILEEARADGLPVTADMYPYPYSGTGLDACLPPWAHEGGHDALLARLRDPETRAAIKADMIVPSDEWENMFAENPPENILLAGFKKDELKPLQGRRLAEVMRDRGTDAADTVLDLILEDESRVFTIYFSMSEDNLRKQVALPWVAFCSDAESQAPEGVFLKTNPHPRAYGAFARLLAKYVRDEGIIPLEQAIHRLTLFPAQNLRIEKRGALRPGYYADVVVFDPAAVQDHATPENPHQYATGMTHVLVNGVPVLRDGEHTGARPGRVVRGPGYQKGPYGYDYPPALHVLLTLGDDYGGVYTEFGIGKEYIPDLIRMATSFPLHVYYEEDNPLSWAPMHAWRRLAQLRATEAIEPLLRVFDLADPMVVMRELPLVYRMFGVSAIAPLKKYIESPLTLPYARLMAVSCLIAIRNDSPLEIAALIETILAGQLENYENNSRIYNAFLVRELVDAEIDVVGMIAAAYAADAVDTDIAGTWREVGQRLGLYPLRVHDHDHDHDHDHEMLGPPARPRADTKKKSKRKQAAKIRKQNRKKKR